MSNPETPKTETPETPDAKEPNWKKCVEIGSRDFYRAIQSESDVTDEFPCLDPNNPDAVKPLFLTVDSDDMIATGQWVDPVAEKFSENERGHMFAAAYPMPDGTRQPVILCLSDHATSHLVEQMAGLVAERIRARRTKQRNADNAMGGNDGELTASNLMEALDRIMSAIIEASDDDENKSTKTKKAH